MPAVGADREPELARGGGVPVARAEEVEDPPRRLGGQPALVGHRRRQHGRVVPRGVEDGRERGDHGVRRGRGPRPPRRRRASAAGPRARPRPGAPASWCRDRRGASRPGCAREQREVVPLVGDAVRAQHADVHAAPGRAGRADPRSLPRRRRARRAGRAAPMPRTPARPPAGVPPWWRRQPGRLDRRYGRSCVVPPLRPRHSKITYVTIRSIRNVLNTVPQTEDHAGGHHPASPVSRRAPRLTRAARRVLRSGRRCGLASIAAGPPAGGGHAQRRTSCRPRSP